MDFRKQSNHNSERDGNRFAASFFWKNGKAWPNTGAAMTSANSMESRSKILSARKTGTAPLKSSQSRERVPAKKPACM